MKTKYILLSLFLLILLTIVSVISENFVLFISATLLYLALIISKIISIYKLKKAQKTPSVSFILITIIYFLALGCFLVFMKDLLILKGASKRGQFKSVRVNEEEIKRNGGVFKYSEYIFQLKEAAGSYIKQSDSIKFENTYYEFLKIKHEPKNYSKKILILVSVHGDEPAGALSIPPLLKDIADDPTFYQNTAISLISPLNPVGLAHTSRENGSGCNINRDFVLKTQQETNEIIHEIEEFKPTLVLDIHENHGEFKTCLLANSSISDSYGELVCKDLSEKGIELESDPVGMSSSILVPKGWSKQSSYEKLLKYFVSYGDLRAYGNSIKLPVLVLECDQSLPIEKRKSICLNTIQATISHLNDLK